MRQPLYFFLPDVAGGVASVIGNIVEYAETGNNFQSNIIVCRDCHDKRTAIKFPHGSKANFERFLYNSRGNFYYTVRRLRKLVASPNPVIVATDLLELEMVHLTKQDIKVVFIVLGDFQHYYGIAAKHASVIDGFIAISEDIYLKMVGLLPDRKSDIHLAYFPTPSVNSYKSPRLPDFLRVIFVGRLEPGKNPLLLVEIDKIVRERGIKVRWTIVGDGPLAVTLKEKTQDIPTFCFTGMISNHELHHLYVEQDIFIMTSESEGLPVSLIEAMKTGLVPVVNNIAGGIREIVKNKVNGFLCQYNNAESFADNIEYLANNPHYCDELSKIARTTTDKQFNPHNNSNQYLKIISDIPFTPQKKKFTAKLPNRLDRFWMPDKLLRGIRGLRNK